MKRRIYRLESTISGKGPYHLYEGPHFDTACLRLHEVPMIGEKFLIVNGRVCAWSSRLQMRMFPDNLSVFCAHDSVWKILELEIDDNDDTVEFCTDGQVLFYRDTAVTIRTFELREFFNQSDEFFEEY